MRQETANGQTPKEKKEMLNGFFEKFYKHKEATFDLIVSRMSYLKKMLPGFGTLPEIEQFQVAMEYFECEKGRVQKAKFFIDVIARIAQLLLAIAALIAASKLKF